ncbi:hypothetical protein ACQJBY_070993 [Aegilops geniculata]
MESRATRRLLAFVSLLTMWSIAVHVSLPAAAAHAPARVGVVVDLTSDVGRKSLTCISKALDGFYLKHPSCAKLVDLRVKDSAGDAVKAAHAAEDLIKNAQVQAIIGGPQPLTKADHGIHLAQNNHIPFLSYNISPIACVFWLEETATASLGHPKIGFTFGSSDSMIFLYPKTVRRNDMKLDTQNSSQDCEGQTVLKIAVPLKNGFHEFVEVTGPISEKQNITGYSIDIFEAAMRTLHPVPCYEFIVFDGPYDELVGNVSLGVYDGAVGDVTITAQRVTVADFTVPYTQSGVSMLVLTEDEPNTISWTFVKPLSKNLWFATIAFLFYTGFVVWMIELPTNQECQGLSLTQCSTALYFVFSTLTFSHGQSIRSPLTKIVVVIWCFVVLILVQSYTASLSSMLTAKRLRPRVSNLDQLQWNDDFVGYQDDSFVRYFLINRHNISESRLRNYSTKEEYDVALRKGSKNGGVSAIVDEIPYLTSFISDSRYKKDFMMLGCIYKTPGFGFAFRQGFLLVHNISTAILNLAEGVSGSQIEVKWFGTTLPSIGASTISESDSAPLTLQSFSGLFVITGSISTLMLLIGIVKLFNDKSNTSRNTLPDQPLGEASNDDTNRYNSDEGSQSIRMSVGNNPNPDQQPLREVSNDDFQGVHREGGNDGGAQPDLMEQNGMHNGSMPAGHIQIEMSNV